MSTSPSPFLDPAKPILEADSSLSDELRADLWDAFHNTKNPEELAQHLQPLVIPDDTKKRLFDAKSQSIGPVEPLDRASAAIARLAALPQDVLDIAESHPNVLKTLAGAATQAEKAAGEPAGALSAGSKGKTAGGSTKAAFVQPDVPATPSGHVLVHASDGGLHHIPVENLNKARAIDPALTVLHVEP